ncbi:MAPEG family protein [Vibrio quintilis]|uniref:Inner membrane protein YecN n=1 Tax=Vibrio quintilis TaxID=1117707 RepID=A0A1M7YWZ4_9VIBR|nr:MAPEG family protein [Vibrio quintilis]SHO57033.1 Inner membrane protein YecN [Vibrio quintilis]
MDLFVTALFGGLFALMVFPMTAAVGLRRARVRVLFRDGGDDTLLRLVRSHANYLEYMPVTLILMAVAELNHAPDLFLYITGTIFLLARVMHYLVLNFFDRPVFRIITMLATTGVILTYAIWLLLYYWSH